MTANLRIPGPTPCPEEVLEACAQPMINHRGPEFRALLYRVTDELKSLFVTKNDLFVITTSGTGAMEAAVVNTMSPGDKALVISVGAFGDRFIEIARAYGAEVTELRAPLGKAVDPEDVRKALQRDPSIKTVLITHNETSTGVTNDLAAVAQIVKGEFDKLLLVDAISSIGSIPCPVDAWDLDVVASSSQKGWMTPPGLAMVSVSQRAWDAAAEAKMPRYYFDFAVTKQYFERGEPPWTPALSIIYALDVALNLLIKEGLENIFARQARIAQMCRDGIKRLGLELFADEAVASDTVTAVHVPKGVEASKLLGLLRTEYNVVLAGGQAGLVGKIFRVGHMGYCPEEDMQAVLDALKEALPRVGFQPTTARRGR